MKPREWGARQNVPSKKGLDFLDTFVVNSGMKEYENSFRWRPPAAIPALDCTVTCASALAFPPTIGFNFNSSHARNPSENTEFLIGGWNRLDQSK